ncbi:glycosyltransferase family 4 protein [Rhodoplanes sp. Z2-YC6860]|uniref:glycosyltransferase family 4 protein n=1 Tax=Rhodoplanes sp. Z2-YC6860 TaxID=674703 RepID=UPI00078B5E0C|nr:glycosyltransferase family 1 protein [Rhodoplanes sp. Z2-YC6860]AMN44981.1 glycosyltransferase WbpX [Rhodoplanes sp. Z2-YC6860]
MAAPDQRLIVDVSTLIRWRGAPVGIVRVEAEIARFVLEREPDVVFSVYDTRIGQFRTLDRDIARQLVEGRATVDTGPLIDPRPMRSRVRKLLAPIEHSLRPLLRLPRTLACWLDERRQQLPQGGLRRFVAACADRLFGRKMLAQAIGPGGVRRNWYRLATALGPIVQLNPGDTMLSPGFDWSNKDAASLAEIKARTGFRLVALCYDLIPIKFPQFYQARDVDVFTRYFRAAILFTDRFIAISQQTATDLIDFAQAHGCQSLDVRTERLGVDTAPVADTAVPLPPGLEAGRFVLFVSTIEPRKNHALLLRVWKRLAAGEQGGTAGCKLVFAGRRGWMVDDLFAAMAADPVLARDVVHVAAASDEQLAALYRCARFCVYPSLYEGFGLPVIEAFAHGKTAVVSSSGSLPEAAGGLVSCLDPDDDDAWVAAIGRRLNDPAIVAEEERRVAAGFAWPSWPAAAASIIALARKR